MVFADHRRENKHRTNAFMIMALCGVFCVCLHTQTTVNAGNIPWLFYRKNPADPQFEPCRDKDDAGSGISGVYLWYNVILLNGDES